MIPEKYQQPICHSLQSLWVGVVPTQTASKKRVKKTREQLGFWGYTRYQLYAPFCGKWHGDIRKTTQLLSSIDRHPKTKTNGNTQSLLKRRSFPLAGRRMKKCDILLMGCRNYAKLWKIKSSRDLPSLRITQKIPSKDVFLVQCSR